MLKENIKNLRKSKGLSQEELAVKLNVVRQTVSKWENGAALPDVLTLMELSRMFGVTLEQLLNGEVAHVLETEDDPHENPDENTDEAPDEEPKEEPIVLKLDTEDILSKRRMAEATEAEANGDAGEAEAVADEETQAEKAERTSALHDDGGQTVQCALVKGASCNFLRSALGHGFHQSFNLLGHGTDNSEFCHDVLLIPDK